MPEPDRLIARQAPDMGSAKVHNLPKHGPRAIAGNTRKRFATQSPHATLPMHQEVEVRDLAW